MKKVNIKVTASVASLEVIKDLVKFVKEVTGDENRGTCDLDVTVESLIFGIDSKKNMDISASKGNVYVGRNGDVTCTGKLMEEKAILKDGMAIIGDSVGIFETSVYDPIKNEANKEDKRIQYKPIQATVKTNAPEVSIQEQADRLITINGNTKVVIDKDKINYSLTE